MRRGLSSLVWAHYFIAAVLILSVSSAAWARQKKKKQEDTGNPDQALPSLSVPEADRIERGIGEMLAAFQIGNLEMMHKYYADNATFVRSVYEPPLVGWQNYAALYQNQRAGFQGMQLVRRNTHVFTHGDVAWASYQWEFDSLLEGKPYSVQGQTTLVFNKVGDRWLIVHNHTSEICPAVAATPQAPGQQTPPPQTPAQNPPATPSPKP